MDSPKFVKDPASQRWGAKWPKFVCCPKACQSGWVNGFASLPESSHNGWVMDWFSKPAVWLKSILPGNRDAADPN